MCVCLETKSRRRQRYVSYTDVEGTHCILQGRLEGMQAPWLPFAHQNSQY